ncbi:restriction endonuclease subunit S [Fusobacterium varium]|uniref:restriction endonuclease subunit S n=1 Tax=Fusobacterium varium TaxID=856 RepID=UPI00189A921D|nr:restriction endonuclease subunit S [Fusobacterium varium]
MKRFNKNEWRKVRIEEVFKKVISGEWGEENIEDSENTVYIIRTTNFKNDGSIDIKEKEVIKRKIEKNKIIDKKLEEKDIIIEKSGGSPNQPVGRVVYFNLKADKEFLCNNFTSILRTKDEIESKYIYYFLQKCYKERKVLKFQNKTTGIINLKLQDYLRNTQVYLPSLDEQKRIVKIMDKVFSIIKFQQEKLLKLEKLSKCLFFEMVKNSRKVLLAEVAEINMGQSPDSLFYNSEKKGIPFFQGKTEFGENYIKEIKYYCSSPIKIAEENSILMSVRAPVGTVNITDVKCCIGRGLASIKNKNIDMLYLFYALKNIEKEIEKKGVGSTFKAITKKVIEKIEIPVVSLEEQNKFAERIKLIEKSKFILSEILKLQSECIFLKQI